MEVFSKDKGETLLPRQTIAIDLELGYNLPYARIYNCSELSGAVFQQLDGIQSGAHEARSRIRTN